MKWEIKKFNELKIEEIYQILGLRNSIFVVEQECPYQDCDGKDKKSYHLFTKENGKIVAYLRVLEKGVSYEQISIGRVCVNKSYRGKGIAKEMLSKAIEFVENKLNEKEIKIQAQAYLLKFYKSFGFKEVSKEYLEDNIPHVDMIYKNL